MIPRPPEILRISTLPYKARISMWAICLLGVERNPPVGRPKIMGSLGAEIVFYTAADLYVAILCILLLSGHFTCSTSVKFYPPKEPHLLVTVVSGWRWIWIVRREKSVAAQRGMLGASLLLSNLSGTLSQIGDREVNLRIILHLFRMHHFVV